nr:MAG TPA: hypothetical protein [Caudoviricetes sp.]
MESGECAGATVPHEMERIKKGSNESKNLQSLPQQ